MSHEVVRPVMYFVPKSNACAETAQRSADGAEAVGRGFMSPTAPYGQRVSRTRSAAAISGRLQSVVSNLSSFAKVQRMPLIVFDDELSRSPASLMNVLHQVNPISLQRICRSRGIVRYKVEVEVFSLIHELDRGVLLVYEF